MCAMIDSLRFCLGFALLAHTICFGMERNVHIMRIVGKDMYGVTKYSAAFRLVALARKILFGMGSSVSALMDLI